MNILKILALSSALTLSACGGQGDTNSAPGAPPVATATAPANAPASTAAAEALQGIVLRVAPGGRPDAFCIPEWSIANQTAIDIPGLLIQIAWHGKGGEVLQAVGEFGTLQEGLSPGRRVDKTLDGHASACSDLTVVLGTYACRDDNAVRMPCPGPVHLLTEGGIEGDTSALKEGSMRGAVEG